MNKIIIFIFLSVVFILPVFSETIVLKSKESIEGKIRGYSSSESYFLVKQGDISKRYYLIDIATIDGIQAKEWASNNDRRDYLILITIVGIIFLIIFLIVYNTKERWKIDIYSNLHDKCYKDKRL